MDTKNLSIFSGSIVLILSIIILFLTKPKMLLNVNDKHQQVVNWTKLIILSVIFALVSAIIVFLMKNEVVPISTAPVVKTTNMAFSVTY